MTSSVSWMNGFQGVQGILNSAVFNLPLSFSLVAYRGLAPTPTFTRATTAYQTDFEGKFNLVLSGEARFQGARREQQLASKETDWTDVAWTATIGTVAATTLTSTGANQTILQGITAASANYVLRIEMYRLVGTGNIQLTLDGGSTWTTVTLTGTTQVFSIAQTGVTNPSWGIRIVTSGDSIYASNIAVYNTTGKTNTNPPEFVSSTETTAGAASVRYFDTLNGNTVASNVVTEATGAKITSAASAAAGGVTAGVVDASGPLGYLAEGARTNDILQSNTLGTTWTISNAADMNAVAADAYVSVDGTTTMDKLQPKNTTAVHSLDQAFTFTAARYTVAVDLRYVPATPQRWVAIVCNDGTTTWAASFDLLNGVAGAVSAAGGGFGAATSTITATAQANVYRCTVTNTANAAAAAGTVKISLNATDTATLESALRAGTETLGAGMVQVEIGAFASSRITTTTVAVTRNADVLTYPSAGNISGTVGTAFADVTTAQVNTTSGLNGGIIATYNGSGEGTPAYFASSGGVDKLTLFDGTASRFLQTVSTPLSTATKLAVTWGGTSAQSVINGTLGSAGTFDGDLGISANLGIGTDANGGNTQLFGTIRAVKIWNYALSASALQTLTT